MTSLALNAFQISTNFFIDRSGPRHNQEAITNSATLPFLGFTLHQQCHSSFVSKPLGEYIIHQSIEVEPDAGFFCTRQRKVGFSRNVIVLQVDQSIVSAKQERGDRA